MFRRFVRPLAGLALAALLTGCVAYPAYPPAPVYSYGYPAPYYGGGYAVVGGGWGWGGGWHGGWRHWR